MDGGAIFGIVFLLFVLLVWFQSWPKACYLCAGLANSMCGCLEVGALCGRCIGIYLASTVTHLTLFPMIALGSMVGCFAEAMVWRVRLLFVNACTTFVPQPLPNVENNIVNNNNNNMDPPVPDPRPWFIAYPERIPGYYIPSDNCLPPCCLSPSVSSWSTSWITCVREQSTRCGYDRESGFHKCTFPNSRSSIHIFCIFPTVMLNFVFGQGVAQFIGMGYAAVYLSVMVLAIPFGIIVFYFQIPYFRGTLYRIIPSKTETYVRYTGSYVIDTVICLFFIPLTIICLGMIAFVIEFPLAILRIVLGINQRGGPFRPPNGGLQRPFAVVNYDEQAPRVNNDYNNNTGGQITWLSLLQYSPISRSLFATIFRMMDVILQGYKGRRYRNQESTVACIRDAFQLIHQANQNAARMAIEDECVDNNNGGGGGDRRRIPIIMNNNDNVPNEPIFLPHRNNNEIMGMNNNIYYHNGATNDNNNMNVINVMNPVLQSSTISINSQNPDELPFPSAPDLGNVYPDGMPPPSFFQPSVPPAISQSVRYGRCPICADTILYPSVTVRLCNGEHSACLLCATRSLRLMLDEGRLSTIGKVHKVLQCPLYMASEDSIDETIVDNGKAESLPSGKSMRKPCTVSLDTIELVYRRSHIALNNPSSPKLVDSNLSSEDVEFLRSSVEFHNEGENRPLADIERKRFIDLAVVSAAAKAREIQLTLQKNTSTSSSSSFSPFTALLSASKDFQLDGDVIFACPHPTCGRLTSARSATVDPLPDRVPSLAYTESTASVKCIHCQKLTCRLCRIPWTAAHVGQTCTQVQRLRRMHSVAHNALFDSLGITFKQCPGCGTGITHYRGHGCHHIRPGSGCTNCGTHFCYVCLYKFPSQGPFSCPFDCPKFCTMDGICGCLDCPDCKPGQPCTECDACRSSSSSDRCKPGKPCKTCQLEKICRSCVSETPQETEERLAKQAILHDNFIKTIPNNRNTNNSINTNGNHPPVPVPPVNNNNNNVAGPVAAVVAPPPWPWQVLPPIHQRISGWGKYQYILGEIDL